MWRVLYDLIFPPHCAGCDRPLNRKEHVLCRQCIDHLPFTHGGFSANNKAARLMQSKVKIYKAASLMFYHKKQLSGKLIHRLKYRGYQKIGEKLGELLAPVLQSDPPGVIIPVPLHPEKFKIRGYNQVAGFGRVLAVSLGAEYRDDILLKTVHTTSQTRMSPLERWHNVLKTFAVRHDPALSDKHLLVVDDVLTTGATLAAAVKILQEAYPEARISIATMALNDEYL